jgi:hypothetical protein
VIVWIFIVCCDESMWSLEFFYIPKLIYLNSNSPIYCFKLINDDGRNKIIMCWTIKINRLIGIYTNKINEDKVFIFKIWCWRRFWRTWEISIADSWSWQTVNSRILNLSIKGEIKNTFIQ